MLNLRLLFDWSVYRLALLLVAPLIPLRLVWRGLRERGYWRHWCERLSLGETTDPGVLWIHAVSVGETRAAAPLITALRQAHPDVPLLLTCMTATGRETALALYGEFAEVRYLPYDYAWLMRRFLRQRRPRLGVLMETELWPNLLGQASRLKVPMVLANARLSARSARGYARLPALTHASLVPVNVAAQSEEDAARLRQLGARAVTVTGNLKFDITPPEDQLELGRRWRAQWASGRLVVLAASTRDGEEAAILPEFAARAADDVMLWIVPRHPQRFDTVAQQIHAAGLRYARRSKLGEGDTMDREVRVLLGDSLGELFAYYAASDVALVGGSLQPLGGQNLIEACSAGCPVLIGPHTFNFEEAARLAIEAGAALRVADARDFWQNAQRLLHDPGSRAAMSAAGLAFAARHRGAAARTAELISPLLAESGIGRSRPDR